MELEKNLDQVWQTIHNSLAKAGRSRDELHLIAVSKTRSAEEVRQLYTLGQLDFGENKPQEIRDKLPLLPPEVRWHMIGHLQANKLKYVAGKCVLIHSVDSLKLAQEIEDYAGKHGLTVDVLLQLDIARDGQKQGFLETEIHEAVKRITEYRHLSVKGLMTVAPYVSAAENNRSIFQRIRQISVDIQAKNYDNVLMNVLSMGMSNDYPIAIEEGATHVRVGTAIFGERNYK